MRRLLPLLLALGCASPVGTSGATAALSREDHGVLRLLNDGEGTSFTFLDIDVALDRRAAENLVAHRDGADGVFGTADDDLFDSIEEVDAIAYVGASALGKLFEFALQNDYVPGDNDVLGSFDGIEFTFSEAERVLELVNTASDDALRDANVPSQGVASILEARPVSSIADLADLYWIGPRTLEHLLTAVAVETGGQPCRDTSECAGELRCTGRPAGGVYGMCRDMTGYPGIQADCDVDSDCLSALICIGQSVYGHGYCAQAWMRDSFTVGGQSSIPSTVMSEPTGHRVTVYGQASVPEDIFLDIDIEHSDPSSLWIGLQPPTGQEPVTLWDGATMTGPLPTHYVDRGVYRDDSVNGDWSLLIQNVGGRGEGVLREWTLTVTSRWD